MGNWMHCAGALCLLLLLSGCASYQLGRPDSAMPRSIHIAPVTNRAEVPQVRALLTDALRETFVRAGGWSLREAADGEVRLHVTVIDLERQSAATSSLDTGRSVSFQTRLVAEVRVENAATGELLVPVFRATADGISLADPGLPDHEYQALPVLCEDLAQQIHDRIAYRWE